MKAKISRLFDHVKTWGTNVFHAPVETSRNQTLEVYRQLAGDSSLVGRLSCEEGQFVFRYDANYRGKPISAFPDIIHVYRSEILWPFFAIRIPPLDREDMRREIASRSLREDQIIEMLGSVAKVSITNPYEFKLSEG